MGSIDAAYDVLAEFLAEAEAEETSRAVQRIHGVAGSGLDIDVQARRGDRRLIELRRGLIWVWQPCS